MTYPAEYQLSIKDVTAFNAIKREDSDKLPYFQRPLQFSIPETHELTHPVKSCTIAIKNITFCKVGIAMADPEPSVSPNIQEPKFGFNEYAERLNGRAAMIGFVVTLVIEYLTGQGILAWLGLY